MFKKAIYILVAIYCASEPVTSQNQLKKWYFGNTAGLDFMTSPPTILTNGVLNTGEGCAAISDALGNLLFYTSGLKIYTKLHGVMANGTGLSGNSSTTQSSIIVKQPGNSNIYFVFTLGAQGGDSLHYSIVDMNLAAGMGSVTARNILLYPSCTEKLTAVQHCNGIDYWVLSHDHNTNVFRVFLVDASGVNLAPITTAIGPAYTGGAWGGNMKVSPNGKKIATALSGNAGGFELFDFDNAAGVVSNYLNLGNYNSAYGVEFSADCSKLYGTREFGFNGLYQWDLCAGSQTAILASEYSIAAPTQIMGMQLATDGMIYVARVSQTVLAVIQNPNVYGAGCNYTHTGQSIAPRTCIYNLPNFITSGFKALPSFTSAITSCTNVNFQAPPAPSGTITTCYATGYTLTGQTWNFGDPPSGANNTSTLATPSHIYPGAGSYQVKLVLQNNCGADTLKQMVVITALGPTLSIIGPYGICAGQITTLTASGADAYSWSNPGGGSPTTVNFMVSPTITTVYTLVGTNTLTGCQSSRTYTLVVSNCTTLNERNLSSSFLVYPNPVGNDFFIEGENSAFVIIYSELGSIVFKGRVEAGKNKIDINNWNDGVYFVKCVNDRGAQITRLVLIK